MVLYKCIYSLSYLIANCQHSHTLEMSNKETHCRAVRWRCWPDIYLTIF